MCNEMLSTSWTTILDYLPMCFIFGACHFLIARDDLQGPLFVHIPKTAGRQLVQCWHSGGLVDFRTELPHNWKSHGGSLEDFFFFRWFRSAETSISTTIVALRATLSRIVLVPCTPILHAVSRVCSKQSNQLNQLCGIGLQRTRMPVTFPKKEKKSVFGSKSNLQAFTNNLSRKTMGNLVQMKSNPTAPPDSDATRHFHMEGIGSKLHGLW